MWDKQSSVSPWVSDAMIESWHCCTWDETADTSEGTERALFSFADKQLIVL